MKVFRKSLTHLRRHKSENLTRSSPDVTAANTTEPKSGSIPGSSFHNLPAELRYMICIYALSNLEIRVTRGSKNDIKPMYVTSSTSLSLLRFHQEVLSPPATDWQRIPWESHVWFVFPSTLSLLDIFASPPWPPERLKLVHKIRLYERQLYQNDGHTSRRWTTPNILDILSFRGLSLDILEYAPSTPLPKFIMGSRITEVRNFFNCPAWSTLRIISIDKELTRTNIYELVRAFILLQGFQRTDAYSGYIPDSPDEFGNVAGKVTGRTASGAQVDWDGLCVADRVGREEWLRGDGFDTPLVAIEYMNRLSREQREEYARWAPGCDLAALVGTEKWIHQRGAGQVKDCFVSMNPGDG